MKYTRFKKLNCVGLLMIIFGLFASCSSTLTADKNSDSELIAQLNAGAKGAEGKKTKAECSEELLNAYGLDVFSTNIEECAALESSGDLRCNQMAQYSGLEGLNLQFYLETDGKNTQCGCQCKEDEVFPDVSPCMEDVRDILLAIEGGGFDHYIFTENYMLIQEVDPDYEIGPSRDRCKFREGVLDISLTTEVVEVNGQTYLACVCENSFCGIDDKQDIALSEKYDDFGQGNEEEPYRIYTEEQLFSMSRYVDALNKHYELCRDIDLDDFYGFDQDHTYFSIGSAQRPFKGTFLGNNNTISNFIYDLEGMHYSNPQINPVYAIDAPGVILRTNNNNVALFGYTEQAKIRNLDLSNVNIKITGNPHTTAGLIGRGKKTYIENISVAGAVQGYEDVGGIVGGFDGEGINLSADVNVASQIFRVGGLIGSFYEGSLSHVSAGGNVSGAHDVGGLIGEVGSNQSTETILSYAQASGNVSGAQYIGGLVGYSRSNSFILRSAASGNIQGGLQFTGGLVGYNEGQIFQSYATADVSANRHVGGLVGYNIKDISQSYATGNILGDSDVGGLVGSNGYNGIILQSYATGDISGHDDVGGLVGYNTNDISQSYATGNISGAVGVGGLVGYNSIGANISKSFTLQHSIIGSIQVGPMNGRGTNIITSNLHYWNGVNCTGSPCTANYGEIPQADANYFFNPNNAPLSEWDFENIWSIDEGNGLPYLDF